MGRALDEYSQKARDFLDFLSELAVRHSLQSNVPVTARSQTPVEANFHCGNASP
jgi:hypothetical protein